MTKEEWANLKRGDIIRHLDEAFSYVVTDTNPVVVTRTRQPSNPQEWLLITTRLERPLMERIDKLSRRIDELENRCDSCGSNEKR